MGIASLFTWIPFIVGLPIAVIGLILGLLALTSKTTHKRRAVAGIVTSSIGLILSVIIVIVVITGVGILGLVGEILPELFELYGSGY